MKKQCVLVGIVVAGALVRDRRVRAAQSAEPAAAPGNGSNGPGRRFGARRLRLPKGVSADGKPLPAGTYQVRLGYGTGSRALPPWA